MAPFRVNAVALGITALTAAALSTGCASSRLSAQAPAGVSLAGDWKLDPSLSDDLGKAITELRAQSRKHRRDLRSRQMMAAGEEGPESSGGPEGGRGRRGRGQPAGQGGGTGDSAEGQSSGPLAGAGPGPRISAGDELLSSVPQGEYLRIAASAGAFTVTSGASSDEYTPGVQSDISAQQGDAQQISGWKGTEYVIDTQPQWGPEIVQAYGLTKEGRLRMTVRLTGGGIRFLFTRIYDRTTQAPPLALPTNN